MLLGWCVFLVLGFSLAFYLEPNPQGYGTHRQLGFPPCTFQALFGIPCPSCGMTTSFSHFVRGNILQSLQSNVAGFLLAVVCALQIPYSITCIVLHKLLWIRNPDRNLMWFLLVLMGLCLVQWGFHFL